MHALCHMPPQSCKQSSDSMQAWYPAGGTLPMLLNGAVELEGRDTEIDMTCLTRRRGQSRCRACQAASKQLK